MGKPIKSDIIFHRYNQINIFSAYPWKIPLAKFESSDWKQLIIIENGLMGPPGTYRLRNKKDQGPD